MLSAMNPTIPKEEAHTFLTSNDIGALATTSSDGMPHVRLVYYAADADFSIYFLSLANTRKADDIQNGSKAAFVVTGNDRHHTLQIEGIFEEMTDTAIFGPMISSLTAHLFPKGESSAPITHLDTAKPVFFKISPTWIRWGDFTHGAKNSEVLHTINPS